MGAVGEMLDGPHTCTGEHTICAKLQIPSDMSPGPGMLRFDMHDSPEIPTHPPNGIAGAFPSPELVAGEETHFELVDAGLVGNYWLFVVIYMPREGQYGIPHIDDYVQLSEPHALPLDGRPVNLEAPIILQRFAVE